jgi:hypothetical protein
VAAVSRGTQGDHYKGFEMDKEIAVGPLAIAESDDFTA